MRNLKPIPRMALSLAALASCLILTTGCATFSGLGQSHQAGSTPHHAPIARPATGHRIMADS